MKLASSALVGLTVASRLGQTLSAFTPNAPFVNKQITTKEENKQLKYSETPYFLSEVSGENVIESAVQQMKVSTIETTKKVPVSKMKTKKAKKATAINHQTGVFSPVVFTAKTVLGEESLNQIRAKAISLHSDVIGKFVSTHDTPFGRVAVARLFQVADRNGDGVLEKDEIAGAVRRLGFTWLGEKQIAGIMKRADTDSNGAIDLEEFEAEVPRTLRNNLVKLAKKNGGDMGLLV